MRAPLFVLLALAAGCSAVIGVGDIHYEALSENGPDSGPLPPEAGLPPSDGGACAADLQGDAKNCGRCGHDCLGATCTAGRCNAQTLASGLELATGIAVDATTVYATVSNANAVLSVPKTGGAAKVLASGQTHAYGVVVDGPTLYWSNRDYKFDGTKVGGVMKCTILSCASTIANVFPGTFAMNVQLAAGRVFAAENGNLTVRWIKTDGTMPGSIDTSVGPFGLAADATHVYWNSVYNRIQRAAVAGGSSEEFATVDPDFTSRGLLAVDSDHVYYTYTNGAGVGQVLGAPKEPLGAPKVSYGPNAMPAYGVAVDANWVYWTIGAEDQNGDPTGGGGELRACKKTGCEGAPIVLIADLPSAGAIATDDTAVYVAVLGAVGSAGGSIQRVAKP